MTQEYFETVKYVQSCTEIVQVKFCMFSYINMCINLNLL